VTKYGFDWGQVTVQRVTNIERSNGIYRILRVNDLEIYISPTGRTRVFRKGDELR
jgi:hypothetical protein